MKKEQPRCHWTNKVNYQPKYKKINPYKITFNGGSMIVYDVTANRAIDNFKRLRPTFEIIDCVRVR